MTSFFCRTFCTLPSKELFHALTFDARHSGYRPPEVSPWTDDLIPVGGIAQLKPALRLMTSYRLMIRDVAGNEMLTSYTRWLECVQVKEGPEPEVYVAFSPRFERIWLEYWDARFPPWGGGFSIPRLSAGARRFSPKLPELPLEWHSSLFGLRFHMWKWKPDTRLRVSHRAEGTSF
jgi:hypothetical protein